MVRIRALVVPALVVGLASGLVYAMRQIHDLTFEVKELRSRLSRFEAPAPRVEATTTVVNLPSPMGDDSLADEVARLRGELETIRAAIGIGPAETATAGSVAAEVPQLAAAPGLSDTVVTRPAESPMSLAGMTPEQREQFKKAVLKVIADKNAEDAQRQRVQMTSKVVADLGKALGLSPVQLERANQILTEGIAKVNELRRQTTDANAKQMKQEIANVWKTMDQGVRSLLTVEQVAQYDTWRTTKIAKQYFGPPPSTQRPAPKPERPGNGKRGSS